MIVGQGEVIEFCKVIWVLFIYGKFFQKNDIFLKYEV